MDARELVDVALATRPSWSVPPGAADDGALAGTLSQVVASAGAAWPDFSVEASHFVRFAVAHLSATATCAKLLELHVADLYLACACLLGETKALRAFDERYLRRLDYLVATLAPSRAELSDLESDLRTRLLIGGSDESGASEPKLADYAGRGPLEAWLRVVATRALISARRKRIPDRPGSNDVVAGLEAARVSPELLHLQRAYAAESRAAFQQAFAALSSRERNLLRYRYFRAMTVDQIAIVYQVHRATAARWVADAEETLKYKLRESLRETLRVSASELDSILVVLHSQLDASLRWTLSETG